MYFKKPKDHISEDNIIVNAKSCVQLAQSAMVLPSRSNGSKSAMCSDNILSKYPLIGEALSNAERNFLVVGVPWLPLTKQTQKKENTEPFSHKIFFKTAVSHISTEALDCYLEDLETYTLNSPEAHTLKIKPLSLYERIPSILLGPALSTMVSLPILLKLLGNSQLSYILVALIAWSGLVISLPLCTNPYRRFSFHSLLQKEINRRKGDGNSLSVLAT